MRPGRGGTWQPGRRPIDGTVPAIARFCDCKVWLTPAARDGDGEGEKPKGIRYIFFGFETDTALAAYFFAVINRAIATETALFKQANPRLKAVRLRRATSSFQHALVARVAERLETMHAEREASIGAQRATGTALVVVKHRVVEYVFRETDVKLVNMYGLAKSHSKCLSSQVGYRRPGEFEPAGSRRRPGAAHLTGTRDYQRSRVYAWENRVIAPLAPGVVSFGEAKGMVNAIWAETGLKYPPAVEPLPKQARVTVASANRLVIFLPGTTASWCLLNEIAHAMTSTAEGNSHGHGKIFMGIYVQLILRYLKIEVNTLMHTLDNLGVELNSDARPLFAPH